MDIKNIKMPERLDKRVKIMKSEHEKIRELWFTQGMTQDDIAAKYGVSHTTISRICSEKYNTDERRQARIDGAKDYVRRCYDKDVWNARNQAYRKRKKELYEAGELHD